MDSPSNFEPRTSESSNSAAQNHATPAPQGFVRTQIHNLRHGRLSTTFALLAALTVGVIGGSMLTGSVSAKQQAKVDSSDARALTIPNPVTLSNGFSAIVKQDGPAVVNINTEQLPKQSTAKPKRRGGTQSGPVTPQDPNGDGQQGDMQDLFNRFFGGQNPNGDEGEAGGSARRALGSGFIVDPRGYIITNNHVVDKADHIYVKLSTDSDSDPTYQGVPATVVGTDKDTDIAVIKIDSKTPLPFVKLGNSDGTQVGDWVLAIGTPFGQRNTVSAGIVSAKNRSIDEPTQNGIATNQFQKFIQTDAAINPGNSGGPLVDMTGAVIGMNTAIYTQSSGSEGIGFAMPSNIIANVYNMLISPDHKVTRGSIGIQFQAQVSSATARVYGFSSGGVFIGTVTPNGPAAKAGLQAQDVIVAVDGTSVKDGDELVAIISAKRPGTIVKITYLRNGKKQTADVGIADRAKLFADLNNGAPDDSATADDSDVGQNKLGITVQANSKGGVTITNVTGGSFAEEIGLFKGEVITAINRKPVTDEASYRAIVKALKSGDDAVFEVHSPRSPGGGSSFSGGTLP